MERFGNLVVIEKTASGGMAEIYKVHPEHHPGRVMALKRIRPDLSDEVEFRRMLLDEAKIALRLDHPNIVRVLGVEQVDDQLGLILEFVDGVDLAKLKSLPQATGGFPVELAVYVALEMLEALDFAHNVRDERGDPLHVVHRDVSPGNVMVDSNGLVRLLDFGIARAKNRLSQTEAGNVKGKFRYMAPEQIRGEEVGPYTDVYATAIVFWELLTGLRIYDEVSVGQLMMRVAKSKVPSLEDYRRDLPAEVLSVFHTATALELSDRYSSARAFATALERALPEFDEDRAREALRGIVLAARANERQRGFQQAVKRARHAAENDLEDALLRALETPDRVDPIDVDWESLDHAESAVPLRRLIP